MVIVYSTKINSNYKYFKKYRYSNILIIDTLKFHYLPEKYNNHPPKLPNHPTTTTRSNWKQCTDHYTVLSSQRFRIFGRIKKKKVKSDTITLTTRSTKKFEKFSAVTRFPVYTLNKMKVSRDVCVSTRTPIVKPTLISEKSWKLQSRAGKHVKVIRCCFMLHV